MVERPRPPRYLVEFTRKQARPKGDKGAALTHTRFVTVEAETLERADKLGAELARNGETVATVIPKRPVRIRSRVPRAEVNRGKHDEQTAIVYARWLAERDGVALPKDSGARVAWQTLAGPDNGLSRKRATAVHFGSVTIKIPNWDFDPKPLAMPETVAA